MMDADVPALPSDWVAVDAAGAPGKSSFTHVASGHVCNTLIIECDRFPPFYSFSSLNWIAFAPKEDDAHKTILLGKDGQPSAKTQTFLYALAASKKKTLPPMVISRSALPVKLKKPAPALPPDWTEKFRDGNYVKFEHRHTKQQCSELWLEELEPGFAPTYWSFGGLLRTTKRPGDDPTGRVRVLGAPPPPPPNVPVPRMPMGWLKKYESRDDDTPYFENFRSGQVARLLFLEEPGIGIDGTSCFWDYAFHVRMTLPPSIAPSDETALIVDRKGNKVEIAQGEVLQYIAEDDLPDGGGGERPVRSGTGVGTGYGKNDIAAGTVEKARSTFGSASPGFSPSMLQRSESFVTRVKEAHAKDHGHVPVRHEHMAAAGNGGATSPPSAAGGGSGAGSHLAAPQSPSPSRSTAVVGFSEFAMPGGWTSYSDDDGDVFFADVEGNAVWQLYVQISDPRSGQTVWWNCATKERLITRPEVQDDDSAAIVVDLSGSRLLASDTSSAYRNGHLADAERTYASIAEEDGAESVDDGGEVAEADFDYAAGADTGADGQQLQQAAAAGAAAGPVGSSVDPDGIALPTSWLAFSDPDGDTYYYNEQTGETTWERPQ